MRYFNHPIIFIITLAAFAWLCHYSYNLANDGYTMEQRRSFNQLHERALGSNGGEAERREAETIVYLYGEGAAAPVHLWK